MLLDLRGIVGAERRFCNASSVSKHARRNVGRQRVQMPVLARRFHRVVVHIGSKRFHVVKLFQDFSVDIALERSPFQRHDVGQIFARAQAAG